MKTHMHRPHGNFDGHQTAMIEGYNRIVTLIAQLNGVKTRRPSQILPL